MGYTTNSRDEYQVGSTLWHLRQCLEAGLSPVPTHGVFPGWPSDSNSACACGNPFCTEAGKHPRKRWSALKPATWNDCVHWELDDTFFHPSNWAFRLDFSSKVVIDVDPRNGGRESFERILQAAGLSSLEDLPRTAMDSVQGRGFHLWFNQPRCELPTRSVIDLQPGAEFKHGKTLVTGPPSCHACGNVYKWAEGRAPWECGFAELPAWLIDLAWEQSKERDRRRDERTSSYSRGGAGTGAHGAAWVFPSDFDLAKVIERARAYVRRMPPGVQGQRGSAPTFRAACMLVQGFGLSIDDALPLMREFSDRCTPPWTDGELLHKLQDAERAGGARGYMLEAEREEKEEWERGKESRSRAWKEERERKRQEEIGFLDGIEINITVGRKKQEAAPTPAAPADRAASFDRLDKKLADACEAAHQQEAEAKAKAAPCITIPSSTFSSTPFSRPYCPRCAEIVMKHRYIPNYYQSLRVACKTWHCVGCHKELNRRWKADISAHIESADEGSAFWILKHGNDRLLMQRLRKRVTRADAEMVRILDANEDFTFITTCDLSNIPGAREITKEDAARIACEAIDAIPFWQEYEIRPVSSSRGWKLIEAESKTDEWQREGMLSRRHGTEEEFEAACQAEDVQIEDCFPKSANTWARRKRLIWCAADVFLSRFAPLIQKNEHKAAMASDGAFLTDEAIEDLLDRSREAMRSRRQNYGQNRERMPDEVDLAYI